MPTSDPHRPIPPADHADDDDEYELEAPDDSIRDHARLQAADDLARANESLEIDRAQRSMEERINLDDMEFRFQFQVKHLLIATTVVSLGFALKDLLNADGFAVLMVMITLGLVAAHAYLSWEEKRRIEAASARRAEALRRIREAEAARQRGEEPTIYDDPLDDEEDEEEAVESNPLRPSFSMRDLMIAMTVAAVVMGLGALLGAKGLAVVLGLVAISGLGAYGLGLPLPGSVVTVWWVTLLMYILVSIARVSGMLGDGA